MFPKSKTLKIWKAAVLPITDFLSLNIGAGIIYLIRYKWLIASFEGVKKIRGLEYTQFSLLLSLAVIIVYTFFELYKINQKKSLWKLVFRLGLGISVVFFGIITFLFFKEYDTDLFPQGIPVSRFILLIGPFMAFYLILLGRSLIWLIEQTLLIFDIGKINLVIIGEEGNDLRKYFDNQNDVGNITYHKTLNHNIFEEIQNLIIGRQVNEIYLLSDNKDDLGAKLASLCERYKVGFIFSPKGLTNYQSFGLEPVIIENKVFLELIHTNLRGWQVILKRIFDIIFSTCFLWLISPIFLLISLAIKLDSKGSLFYLSDRTGPDGKSFKLFKFRRFKQEFCTSETNPDSKAALEYEQYLIETSNLKKGDIQYKIKDDPRMTRVGRFLEKTSLDELPQFLNVLVGNMSVVGPRPHQPRDVAKYQPHHFKVLNIKPGITGLAQINGRSDLSFDKEVEFDRFYLEHWNFWWDIFIIIKTPLVIIFRGHKQ